VVGQFGIRCNKWRRLRPVSSRVLQRRRTFVHKDQLFAAHHYDVQRYTADPFRVAERCRCLLPIPGRSERQYGEVFRAFRGLLALCRKDCFRFDFYKHNVEWQIHRCGHRYSQFGQNPYCFSEYIDVFSRWCLTDNQW